MVTLAHSVAAAALVLCLPAFAQDLAFSPEATETCLADGGGAECIGLSAGLCTDSPDGYTTVGMGFCYGEEWRWWDARLNDVYGRLMAVEAADDAEMKEIGASAPEKAPALRDLQRAWIPYRDALCDYERVQWGGGTGQGPATAACLMQETGRQVLLLEGRLAAHGGR